MSIVNRYEDGNYIVTEYSSGAVERVIKSSSVVHEYVEPQPTLEEMQMQTLLNTEYLVIISELSNL